MQSGLLINQRFKTSTDCKDNSEHAADCAGYYSNGYCDTGTILVKLILFPATASATVLVIYSNSFLNGFLCLRLIPKVLFQILHPYYQQIVNTTRGWLKTATRAVDSAKEVR